MWDIYISTLLEYRRAQADDLAVNENYHHMKKGV